MFQAIGGIASLRSRRGRLPAVLSLLSLGSVFGLATAVLPARAQFSTVINVPPDEAPASIGSDTLLNVFDGGTLPPMFNAGLRDEMNSNVVVNIAGGAVGNGFQAHDGSVVSIAGGTVGHEFWAARGSVVSISGGGIGRQFHAEGHVNISGGTFEPFFFAHGIVSITGGSLGRVFHAGSGSVVNIAGGSIGGPRPEFSSQSRSVVADYGSHLNISGGAIGDDFRAYSSSNVTIFGEDFRWNAVPVDGSDLAGSSRVFDLPEGGALSGTLTDGTPFAFSWSDNDEIHDGTLTLVNAPTDPVGPVVISVPSDPVPPGVRAGQSLIVPNGGVVGDNFSAGRGSSVTITGGEVGGNFEAAGAPVNLTSGSIGSYFDAFSGSVVNISGGSVDHHMDAFFGSVVNISGGVVGGDEISSGSFQVDRSFLEAHTGSVVNISGGHVGARRVSTYAATPLLIQAHGGSVFNISGGTIGDDFAAHDGSVVNISGGVLGIGFRAHPGSNVNVSAGSFGDGLKIYQNSTFNLFGSRFLLDGEEILDIAVGETLIITERDVTLNAIHLDGSSFAFDLGTTNEFHNNYVDPDAMLTITLVGPLTGDYNDDGVVNAADYLVWRNHQGETFQLPNEDPITTPGEVTQSDYYVWRHNFGRKALDDPPTADVVPEPASLLSLWLAMLATTMRRRRAS